MSNFVMLDYIHETQEAALGILEKRAEICGEFAHDCCSPPAEPRTIPV